MEEVVSFLHTKEGGSEAKIPLIMPGPGSASRGEPAQPPQVLRRGRSFRQVIVGRGERVILGALMSVAVTLVERRLKKAFGTRTSAGRASGAP